MMTESERRHQDRILWASRRGMLELDLILEAYAKEAYPHAEAHEREAFQALLSMEDQTLFDWLVKLKPADGVFSAIVEKVRMVKKQHYRL